MNTITAASPRSENAAATSSRIVSIDVFRGLTMAVMIFVNALSEVRGLPWWTYHAHADQDLMTYVDMVFPTFLFIVGMSMPLSIEQRLTRTPSLLSLWFHVLVRAASLLVLGLILANAEKADTARMGIGGSAWALVGLVSAVLYLNVYPKSDFFARYAKILRAIGFAGVVLAFAMFRRAPAVGRGLWIDPSYPEILGLIGFTYFAAAVLYIPTRRWRWAAPAWFVALLAFCACSAAKLIPLPHHLHWWVWPFDNGAMGCIVMAGVVTSQIFLGTRAAAHARLTPMKATVAAVAFGAAALFAGWLLMPLGISKIRATPTWALWSVGAAVLLFTALYWICDQKRQTSWAGFLRPAGNNTLLTYLLPDIVYFLLSALGIQFLDVHFNTGWPGVAKTLVFTLLMLYLSSVLTRAKIRLQL